MKNQSSSSQVLSAALKIRCLPIPSALLGLSALAMVGGFTPDSIAQEGQKFQLEEVVVTARRREERLQDVPISISVFSQQQIDDTNMTQAADLATYTPNLVANNRFGQDSTTFQIRGFTQELRTTSSVGVYFAEVIAPRGANTSNSGDGAGPGDLFDLENVQVLKGPQGTLFGRNTTGGAVLITPKKPTDELEGYAEVSYGNYDMTRAQAVINIPVYDWIRMRFGVERQKRDGYYNNVSGVGPDKLNNVDYTAFRASVVLDITENLENYTIFKSLDSKNNNTASSIIECNPATFLTSPFGALCGGDLARRQAIGATDFYDVWSNEPNPVSKIDSWQGINTTAWEITDNLTVKNIISYAELKTRYTGSVYGTNWLLPDAVNTNAYEIPFGLAGPTSRYQGDSSTFVEELQFQGNAIDDRLTWQAGLYYEKTKPEDDYGSQSWSWLACDRSTVADPNPANWRCNDALIAALLGGTAFPGVHLGRMSTAPGGVKYVNKAAFTQASFTFTDAWSVTAGLRYTKDDTNGYVSDTVASFPGTIINGGYFPADSITTTIRKPETDSDRLTWLAGVDYKPTSDMLIYAKYNRGYRQGSVNLAGNPPYDTHGPEKVDTYEIGTKTRFDWIVPATFNVSVFYNDFSDQQVQLGYLSNSGVGTTAILNAGSSTIWGVEAETAILLTDNLTLSVSYSHLNTNVDNLVTPDLVAEGLTRSPPTPTVLEGEDLSFAPKNQAVSTLSYLVPMDEAMGDLRLSATWVYNDNMNAVSPRGTQSPYAVLPSLNMFNLNADWKRVGGSAFDLSAFATNVTNQHYYTFITGNWTTFGESGQMGQPRMYGVRARYNF